MRYQVDHSKIKFISTHGHVISSVSLGTIFHVHSVMSHLQKVILICRFFSLGVGGWGWVGGGILGHIHVIYVEVSPCTFNLQAGPLQDSVRFPSLNYLNINVLIHVSRLVVHAHG